MDFETAKQQFVNNLKAKKRSISTILAYENDVRQLSKYLAEKQILKIENTSTEHISAFKDQLFEKKYTAKSISRKLNSIKTFFRFLKDQGVIAADPAQGIAHPKFEAKKPRILSKMEYRALRDAARDNSRMSAIIELLLQTGMKIGELGRLETANISDKEIRILAYESQDERNVPLNQAARRALERYLAHRPQTRATALFVTKTGRPFLVRNIRTAIDRYFRLAGINEARVNSLRHTFIAHQLAKGAPVTLVQKLAGHKRLSTTEKYLDLVEKKEEETVRLEEL